MTVLGWPSVGANSRFFTASYLLSGSDAALKAAHRAIVGR